MDEQPPQKRAKLRNDGFPGASDSGKCPLIQYENETLLKEEEK